MGDSKSGNGRDPASLYPQLRPRRNASPEAVAEHQRARLHSAIVEACAGRGYTATTIAELVAIAGVSKKTLYKHFANKEDLFLTTYDLVIRDAAARISAAYREPSESGDWTVGLCSAFDAFVAELVERPKASRLALVDVLAIGPDAFERIERAQGVFIWMIARSLAQAPDRVSLPPLLLRSLTDGIWLVSRTRLLEGKPAAVSDYGRELLDWILSYREPVVESLPRTAAPRQRRRPVSPLDSSACDERVRMLCAAAEIASKRGYSSLSIGGIAERAGVSPEAVTSRFESPRECFLASLELFCARALARALRSADDAEDWPTGACRAMGELLCQIADDRVLARTAFLESVAAGPGGVEGHVALIRGFANALLRRVPSEQRPSPLVAEAIVGSVWSIVYRCVAEDRAERLPALAGRIAYLVLAPMVGAATAHEVILAELGPDRSAYAAAGSASTAAAPFATRAA